ncbi:MAG: hypothetical protein JNK42_05045 [Caedimonas sp.]|nr:hypothetical protein [Caedimonas sp.]
MTIDLLQNLYLADAFGVKSSLHTSRTLCTLRFLVRFCLKIPTPYLVLQEV